MNFANQCLPSLPVHEEELPADPRSRSVSFSGLPPNRSGTVETPTSHSNGNLLLKYQILFQSKLIFIFVFLRFQMEIAPCLWYAKRTRQATLSPSFRCTGDKTIPFHFHSSVFVFLPPTSRWNSLYGSMIQTAQLAACVRMVFAIYPIRCQSL